MIPEIPEQVKRYAEWHKAAYGWNPFEPYICPTCKAEINVMFIYRCYECHVGFCCECLKLHCAESRSHSKQIQQSENV